MSPGSQIRALTANRARPNRSTIAAGRRVERRKDMAERRADEESNYLSIYPSK
jgi:hypothetical protein